jgi:hypothetical protein
MQTRKKVEYFKIKWIDIAPEGCTWEPAAHLIGDQAKAALSAFRQQRAAQQEADDAIRRARRAGKAAEANAQELSPDDDLRIIDPQGAGPTVKRANGRKQSSDVWRFFHSKEFNEEEKGFYARCKICSVPIKVCNTTNLQAHLNSCHPKEVVEFKVEANKVRQKPIVSACVSNNNRIIHVNNLNYGLQIL